MKEEFNKNLIILDIDGVQANIVDKIEEYMMNRDGILINKNTFDLGLSQDDWNILIKDKELFESADPYPGIKDTIDSLKNRGMYIWSVTARELPLSVTILWMKKHDIYFDRLDTYTNKERVNLVKRESPLIYVDDKFENVIKSCDYVKYPIIIDRPWNNFYNPKIIRINFYNQLISFLENSNG